jgi:hypothetical protein
MSHEIENVGWQKRTKLPQTAAYLDPRPLSALIRGQARRVALWAMGVQYSGHYLREERLEGAPLGRKCFESPRFALGPRRCD